MKSSMHFIIIESNPGLLSQNTEYQEVCSSFHVVTNVFSFYLADHDASVAGEEEDKDNKPEGGEVWEDLLLTWNFLFQCFFFFFFSIWAIVIFLALINKRTSPRIY